MIKECQCDWQGCKRPWEHTVMEEGTDELWLLCDRHFHKMERWEWMSRGGLLGFIGGVLDL